MSAVITNNQLLRTENRLTAAMERLSSGLKLNSAEDNPAGMAISNKMKAQIDGLDQAEDNATDGVSVLQIADGALNEVHSMLQRMRELSVQAANGTNSVSDKESMQKEIEQLRKEVDRISEDTEYNTKKLLDGSSDIRTYAEHATRIQVSDYVEAGNYALTVEEAAKQAEESLTFAINKTGSQVMAEDATKKGYFDAEETQKFSIAINDTVVTIDSSMTEAEAYEAFRNGVEEAGCLMEDDGAGNVTIRSGKFGSEEQVKLSTDHPVLAEALFGMTAADYEYDEDSKVYEKPASYGEDVKITLDTTNSKFEATASATSKGNRVNITDMNGFQINFQLEEGYAANPPAVDGKINFEVTEIGAMTIQLGANQYQTMDVRIPEISEESLYLDEIDVVRKGGAEDAMETLDEAIAAVSDARSRIGASQNRLEYAVSSLAGTQENMTSAYSTLVDTDMAETMTEYTQQTILDQAAISVLSQANQIPQQVLSLLGH